MDEYAKKKQAAIDRRERFRLKHQVIEEQADDTDAENNTQYELEYPLESKPTGTVEPCVDDVDNFTIPDSEKMPALNNGLQSRKLSMQE